MEDSTIGFLTKMLFPEYEDIPDEELGMKMREKFPWLFEEAEDDSSLRTIESLQGYSNTSRGGFTSNWQKGKSVARTALDEQLIEEIIAKNRLHSTKNAAITMEIERRAALFTQREAASRMQEARNLEKATHHNELTVAEAATKEGLDKDKYLSTQEAHRLDEIRLSAKERESAIEVNKHREMKDIDIEVLKAEAGIDVTGAIVSRVAEQFEVELLTQRLFKQLDLREVLLLEADSESKSRKLKRLNKNIRALERAIDEKAQGLIQGNSRPELKAMEES